MDALSDWLNARGLGALRVVLEAQQIDLDILPDLTEDDLKDLGIALGPRRRLLKAIAMAGVGAVAELRTASGDRKESEEHFKIAQRLDRRLTGVRIGLAQLYVDMGRYPEARRELQAVLAEPAPTARPRRTLEEMPRARRMLESIRDRH